MQPHITISQESWRPIPGYGRYEVSNLGRVRSYLRPGNHKNKKLPTPRIMSESTTRGYKTVALTKDGRCKTYRVHRLVLEVFGCPRPEGYEAGHLNGDKRDNRLANLMWISHRGNEAHKRRHGTDPSGERNGLAKLVEWQVIEIKYLLSKGITQARLARLFDVSRSAIHEIAAGHAWSDIPTREDIPYLLAELRDRDEKLRAVEDWADRFPLEAVRDARYELDRILQGGK